MIDVVTIELADGGSLRLEAQNGRVRFEIGVPGPDGQRIMAVRLRQYESLEVCAKLNNLAYHPLVQQTEGG